MNWFEFQDLKTLDKDFISLSAKDLENTEPRTLIDGYTCARDDFYVELYSDGRIIIYVNGKIKVPTCYADYVPDKRVYPEECDYEFCKLLIQRGVSIPFTNWTGPIPQGAGPWASEAAGIHVDPSTNVVKMPPTLEGMIHNLLNENPTNRNRYAQIFDS